MIRVIATGHAECDGESLDFKVGDWAGGVGLMIRRTGDGSTNETGAGIWPSVEKAKSIAQQATERLFGPHREVVWTSVVD